ncbi:amino acid adenylation domain-containing protein [Lysinibacillus xylanilyticus]|uniref:amino acid adenylation domain-containing protein n=1 Tax=Lysinibacillus xylanilyticus TaxID=582475 RepID=UPI003D0679BD
MEKLLDFIKLEEVWMDILKIDQIEENQNYFECGGSSLEIMELISEANKKYNCQIDIKKFFQNPTYPQLKELVIEAMENQYRENAEISCTVEEYETDRLYDPLSPTQELIFLDILRKPETIKYNITQVFEIKGELDPKKVERAMGNIIVNHNILASNFKKQDGKIVSFKNCKEFKLVVTEEDIEKIPHSKVFDLENDLLIRLVYVKNPEKNYLIFDSHHLVLDGASVELLLNDLQQLLVFGEEFIISNKSESYRTFVDWYVSYRNSQQYQDKLIQFSEKVKGYEPSTLPAYKLKNKNENGYFSRELKTSSIEALHKIIQKYRKSEFVSLLSVFYLTMYAFTGNERLLIGTPVSVRKRSEFKNMIGMFVNSLPLNTTISMNQSPSDYLKQVSLVVADSLEHQEITHQDILHYLKQSENSGRMDLFSTMFLVENKTERVDFEEFSLSAVDKFETVSKDQKMTFRIRRFEQKMVLDVNFDPSLYNLEMIKSFYNTFEIVLSQLGSEDLLKLSDIQFISPWEEERIMGKIDTIMNKNLGPIPGYYLFEKIASERGDEICIEDSYGKKTWNNIHEEVSKVVYHMVKNGYDTKQPIGLSFDRNSYQFVAILAVMKMGGCFVVVDKKYDVNRKKEIIEMAEMKYILSDEDFSVPSSEIQVINIQNLQLDDTKTLSSSPTVIPDPKSLMNIVFSSGTTGRPKGIQMTYENFSLLHKNIDFLEVTNDSKILSITNYTFDVFLTAISFMLYNGAIIVLADEEMILNSNKLARYAQEKGVTHICCPTSIYHNFKEDDVKYLLNIKLLCAGERMGYTQSKMFYEHGHRFIYNGYGPAESCIYTTSHLITGEDFKSNFQEIFIGRPLDENFVLLIDKYERILPKYAQGELVIFGKTLSPGYHNQLALTEDRFSSEIIEGYKSYKTGDIVSIVQDDKILYIDRLDTEIKVRGHRVNTKDVISEIEKLVYSSNIVVLVDNNRLVCFVENNNIIDKKYVMNELKNRLPSYMIPSIIHTVSKMPVNLNGKVDKKQLINKLSQESIEKPLVTFENEIERELCDIWKKVLDYNDINRESNFFSVGGHSLKIMELQFEIENKFQVKIPTNLLFSNQLLKEQALLISFGNSDEIQLDKHEYKHNKLFPVTPLQESLFTIYLQEPLSIKNNIVLLSRITEDTNITGLKNYIEQEIESQDIFKTRFEFVDGQLFQKYDKDLQFCIEEHYIQNKEQIEDLISPFDFNTDMLIKVLIVHTSTDSYLLVNVHHIIFDGESAKILVENLLQRMHGEKIKGPDYNFIDYSEYLSKYKGSEKYKEDQKYWQHLVGVKNVTVPYDFEDETIDENERISSISEMKFETLQLNYLSKHFKVSKMTLMLAAFHLAVGKLSGEKSLAIGTSIGLRMQNEFKGTIGPFVNTLPIYSHIESQSTVADFISNVNYRYIEGVNHINIGFPEMVNISKVERDKKINPIFNVMFIYHPEYLSSSEEIVELGLKDGQLLNVSEKFDLTMNFLDLGDQAKISVTYDVSKYREQTIKILIEKTLKILSQLDVEGLNIEDLQYQTATEKKILTLLSNNVDPTLSKETILDYWNRHVQECPTNICIEKKDDHLTFLEVDQRANFLASQMLERGVKPFDSIGFLFDRSIEMYVSIIANLKLGTYYVPLEIEADIEYLNSLIEDANIRLVLTEKKLQSKISSENCIVVSTDKVSQNEINMTYNSTATLALLYTSGTTGKPKGILINHDNMINLSNAVPGNKITRKDTLIQIANYTFDISSVTFFNSIIKGAKLVLCDKNDLLNIEQLAEYLIAKKVTYIFLPTAIFHLFNKSQIQELSGVTFIAGGEVMSKIKIKEFLENENIDIYNMYGPTETSVYSTIYKVEDIDRGPIPIGQPVYNTCIKVLNDLNQECDVTEIGELYIGGRGVTKGYLNLEQETEKRFVTIDGTTYYKTGDFVRITTGGQIEFKGRRDKQVKINGYRIEIQEIENAIKKEFKVNNITVIYSKNRLIAFIADEFEKDFLQNNVKKILASYKCPKDYLKIDQIPLTLRGKIDEKKLISLYEESYKQEKTLNQSSKLCPLEQKIKKLWAEVLAKEENEENDINTNDNFFDIGGSSIQAISLVSKMRKEGLAIQFEDLMTFQTIKEMSVYLQSNKSNNKEGERKNLLNDAIVVFPAYMEETMYNEVFKRLTNKIMDKEVYILDFYNKEDYLEYYTNKVKELLTNHNGKIYLMGYSFGGALAHEISIRLNQLGYKIDGIIMLDSYFAKGKNFYKKMLRGTFLSKRAAVYQLEKAYPQFKEIDGKIKIELISKFEEFYKATNMIINSHQNMEIPLYFVKSNTNMKTIEDTRDEWKNIYQNYYTELPTAMTHTDMMKLDSLNELSLLIDRIFDESLNISK